MRVELCSSVESVTVGFRRDGEPIVGLSALALPQVRRMASQDLYPRAPSLPEVAAGISRHSFTTIESGLLLRIHSKLITSLVGRHIVWARAFSAYPVMHTLTAQTEFALARSGSAGAGYTALLDQRPELLRRVTQREIAKLLGVSEAGLSRVVKHINAQRGGSRVR